MVEDPWALAEVDQTIATIGLSSALDTQLPDEVRFVREVKATLSKIVQRFPDEETGPAVFILGERPDDHPGAMPAEPRFFIGDINPAGRLWFGGAAARKMSPISPASLEARDVFRLVEEMGFGGATAVYYQSDAPEDQAVTIYPYGLSDTESVLHGPVVVPDSVNIGDIAERVDRIHDHALKTPRHQRPDFNLWADTSAWDVQEDAERRVQDTLLFFLSNAYHSPYFMLKEISGHAGRYDISLHQSLPARGQTVTHAIIELKVIRSFGSNHNRYTEAKWREALVSGLTQAAGYVKEHNPRQCACFYFDLRHHDDVDRIEMAENHSRMLDIPLRGWRCLPSAEAYQVEASLERSASARREPQ